MRLPAHTSWLTIALSLPWGSEAFTGLARSHSRISSTSRGELEISSSRRPPARPSGWSTTLRHAANKDKDDDLPPGMADAFRRLESLESVGDLSSKEQPKMPKQAAAAEQMTQAAKAALPSYKPPVPLEKEAQMYQEMVKELESMNEDELYDSILMDMGDEELTAKVASPKATAAESLLTQGLPQATGGVNDELMNQALEAAITEIDKDYPALKDSILNDKELMKEIEAIFDKGNEKLMLSLEDIRKEQSDLARASANNKAQSELDLLDSDTRRLEQAEASISTMLKRVNAETAEVAAAVEDLKRAQTDIDKDFLFRLKNGGIVKQSALVGLVLFSVRSIVDSVASFGDESHLVPALAQGAIAIVCAAYFFLA